MSDIYPNPRTIVRDNCLIKWVDKGEGQSGKFNKNDPSDLHLLRFEIFFVNKSALIPVASIKSQTSFDQPEDILKTLLVKIADRVAEPVSKARPSIDYQDIPAIEEALEELAWIGPEWTFEW